MCQVFSHKILESMMRDEAKRREDQEKAESLYLEGHAESLEEAWRKVENDD